MWGVNAYRIFKNEFDFYKKASLFLILAIQAVQLFVFLPGMISYDDLETLRALSIGQVATQGSNLYTLLMQSSHLIFNSALRLSYLNLILFSFIVFLVFRMLPKKIPLWCLPALIILFSLPQSTALVLFQNRDSIFSLLLVWWSLGLFSQNHEAKSDPWFHLGSLSVLTLCIGELRQEAKIFVFIFPIAFWWRNRNKSKFYAQVGLSLTVISLLLNWAPKYFSVSDAYADRYLATTLINPLSYILHVKGPQEASKSEKDEISRFFIFDNLIEYFSMYDINPLHRGGIVPYPSPEDFAAFRRASLSILSRNLNLLFENRKRMALCMLNFEGRPAIMYDSLSLAATVFQEPAYYFKFEAPAEDTVLKTSFRVFHSQLQYELPYPLHILISSCLIPIMVFVILLGLVKTHPELTFIGLSQLLRLAILIILTPAAYFKYITSFWLIGWLVLILYFAQSTGVSNKNSAKSSDF